MAFTERTFGVEIEFVGDRNKAVTAIKEAGLLCHMEGYDSSHRTPTEWKVTTDSSIEGGASDTGELVSPILRGEDGLEQIRKALKALRGLGHTVNRSCGVHVHVGVRDLAGDEIVNVFKRYKKFEGEIDGFMPVSRRANNNTRFIQSLSRVNFNDSTNARDVSYAMDEDRYFKLNVMAYFRQKTLEFRQHSGSLSGEKVCNWVRFCVNFVEASRNVAVAVDGTVTAAPAARRGRRPSENSAKAKVMTWFRERSYYMYDHNARDLGLNVDSLATVMSGLRGEGWEIRRNRRAGYYYCSRIPTTPVVAWNANTGCWASNIVTFNVPTAVANRQVVADSLYNGLDDSTIQFFRERAAEFAER